VRLFSSPRGCGDTFSNQHRSSAPYPAVTPVTCEEVGVIEVTVKPRDSDYAPVCRGSRRFGFDRLSLRTSITQIQAM